MSANRYAPKQRVTRSPLQQCQAVSRGRGQQRAGACVAQQMLRNRALLLDFELSKPTHRAEAGHIQVACAGHIQLVEVGAHKRFVVLGKEGWTCYRNSCGQAVHILPHNHTLPHALLRHGLHAVITAGIHIRLHPTVA